MALACILHQFYDGLREIDKVVLAFPLTAIVQGLFAMAAIREHGGGGEDGRQALLRKGSLTRFGSPEKVGNFERRKKSKR